MPVDLSPLVDSETDLIPYEEADPRREYKAHIINFPANRHIWRNDFDMSSQDIVDIARATGQHVVALCGYKFVPKHNPDKHDACEICVELAGHLMRERGE